MGFLTRTHLKVALRKRNSLKIVIIRELRLKIAQ